MNADYKLFDWLQVGSNLSIEKYGTKSVSQRGYSSSFDSMLAMDPLTPVYWTTPEEMSASVKAHYDRIQAGGEGRHEYFPFPLDVTKMNPNMKSYGLWSGSDSAAN